MDEPPTMRLVRRGGGLVAGAEADMPTLTADAVRAGSEQAREGRASIDEVDR